MVDDIYTLQEKLDISFEIEITYGSMTKLKRKELGIEKSHVNDAYVMGDFHPKHRCKTERYQKKRQNNRILSKFYDTKYIYSRDKSIKTGKELSNGRTNRNHKRDSENLHKYRKQKVTKGKITVRKLYPTYLTSYDLKKVKKILDYNLVYMMHLNLNQNRKQKNGQIMQVKFLKKESGKLFLLMKDYLGN